MQVICSSPSEISRVRVHVRSKSILVHMHVHSFVCHLQPAPGACHPSVRMRVVRSAPAGAASRASAAYASPLFACGAAASEPVTMHRPIAVYSSNFHLCGSERSHVHGALARARARSKSGFVTSSCGRRQHRHPWLRICAVRSAPAGPHRKREREHAAA